MGVQLLLATAPVSFSRSACLKKMRVSVACVLCIFSIIFLSFTPRTEASITSADFEKILADLKSLNAEFGTINDNYKKYKTDQSEGIYQKDEDDEEDEEDYDD